MELIRLRRRRVLAEDVLDILKKVMAALTVALFEIVKEIPDLRSQIRQTLLEAYDLYNRAAILVGSRKIEEVSRVTIPVDYSVSMEAKSGIIGITVPVLNLEMSEVHTAVPRYSLSDTSSSIDESGERMRSALEAIVKLVEAQASLKEVLEAMSIKRRQTNRIQHRILPQLDFAIRYIETVLEETERQDTVRIRVLQRKRKRGETD
jgi:H(+)-transporting ATP synthase subunit D